MLGDTMSEPAPATGISLRYAVAPSREAWELPEGPVPESTTHRDAADDIKQVPDEWVRRTGRSARIVCNLAIGWDLAHRGRGVDPDVCVLEPPPSDPHIRSLRTWDPGHVVPRICFEVVSESHPYKDYAEVPERYAAMGTRELVVFDPLLAGPVALGEPVPLQIWRRTDASTFERVYSGEGPAFREERGAWLHPDGPLLRFTDDREGTRPWLTALERALADKERALADSDRGGRSHLGGSRERHAARSGTTDLLQDECGANTPWKRMRG